MTKPPYDSIYTFLRDIQLWFEIISDWVPDFETRMINRERRFRRRFLEGKISKERLDLELDTIDKKRKKRQKTPAE